MVLNAATGKIRFSTKIRVPVKDWNGEKSEVKRSHPNFSNLNEKLRGIVSRTESAVLELQRAGKAITDEVLKTLVLSNDGQTGNTYQHFKELYISKKKVKTVTLRNIHTSFNQMEAFAAHGERSLDPARMDGSFFEDWQEYSNVVLNNSNSGHSRKVKDIKAFLTWLFTNGHLKQDNAKLAKRSSDSTEIFPLIEEELLTLEEAHRNGRFQNQRAEVLRRFLFACYTGLRFGDWSKVGSQHLRGKSLHFNTSKTSASVKIPLLEKARKLLPENTEGAFFPVVIANQNCNRELKNIFVELELFRLIEKPIKKGAETTRVQMKLSDKIGTHDARRTFITLSLQKGMNHWQIMQITGHKNMEMFRKYVRFTDEQVAKNFFSCWETNDDKTNEQSI